MKKIFFDINFSCANNNITLKRVFDFCVANKYEIVDLVASADWIILDSCILVSSNIDKIKDKVSRYFSRFPDKKIIIIGCVLGDKRFNTLRKKAILLGIKDLSALDMIFSPRIPIGSIGTKIGGDFFNFSPIKEKHKAYLKTTINCIISRGCLGSCSYCNTKNAIGYPKSKGIEEIKDEIKKAMITGREDIQLLSDDGSGYGADIKINIFDLIRCLFRDFKNNKFSITNIPPHFFLSSLNDFESILQTGRIKMLSLTVQSASSRIIKLMNRSYDPQRVLKKVRDIKKKYPKIKLTTHLLVCFPTETRKEFLQNLKAAKFFDEVILNIYNPIPGTPAAGMRQLSKKEIERRRKLIKRMLDSEKVIIGTD